MSNNTVQELLCNTIAGLFRDEHEARDYAERPQEYLREKVAVDDYADVDLKEAVREAAQRADLPPHEIERVTEAMYQPAPVIRVPKPTDEYRTPDRDVKPDNEYDQPDDDQPDDDQPDADQPNNEYDQPDYDKPDYDKPDYDQPNNDDDQPDHRIPDGCEETEGGGYRVPPHEDYTPETYAPDTYSPPAELDPHCVEYTVSNCVTTCYREQPEIADRLCETRDYADPYPREPGDAYELPSYADEPEYGNDEYDDKPVDEYEDKPEYDDKPVDEYEDKPEYDDKPADQYGDKPEYGSDDHKPTDNYDDKPDNEYDDKPQYDDKPEYGNDDHTPTDDYGNGAHEPVAAEPHEPAVALDEYGQGQGQDEYVAEPEPAMAYEPEPEHHMDVEPEPAMAYEPEPEHYEPEPEMSYEPEPAATYEPEPEHHMDDDPMEEAMIDG